MIQIERFSFGSMRISGRTYTSDLKIMRGEVFPNWWRNGGHRVEVADLTDLLAAKPVVVVLGCGDPGRMTPTPDLRKYLQNAGIRLIEASTPHALKQFNQMVREGQYVAAGFHLTC